jgi:hypothetical protein
MKNWRVLGPLRIFGLLTALSALAVGCGTSTTPPPGGTQAVAYWHQLLQRYPDLPAKVEAIVQQQRSPNAAIVAEAEVRVYGADEVVAVRGRHVDVIVTDLDEATLKKLLAWWKEVPRLARELNVDFPLPLELPSNTRHIVVLGSEGYVAVQGPGGYDVQSVRIVDDQVAARTTIAVHAFGPEGETALGQLSGAFDRLRGPPDAEVRSGHIGLPPPDEEETVTVLVVGQLRQLDIAGPTDYAQQDISFANFLNQHQSTEQTGTLAGQPFGRSPEYVAEQPRAEFVSPEESIVSGENSSTGGNSGNNSIGSPNPNVSIPGAYQPNNFKLPETYRPLPLPYDTSRPVTPVIPNTGGGFRPGYVPRYGGS